MTPEKTLQDVAIAAAQQSAMAQGVSFLPHGSRLFRVSAGWQSRTIAADPKVRSCDTLLSLEAALRDEDVSVIFIPSGASVGDADVEKLCARNGVAKTLFKEVDEA